MVGSKSTTKMRKSSLAMRYLAAIDPSMKDKNECLGNSRLLTVSPRSRSPHANKSVKTSKTSVTGTDQSIGSTSVGVGSWTVASPSRAMDLSQDLTTPGSLRRTEKVAKAKKRLLQYGAKKGEVNLSKDVRNHSQQQQNQMLDLEENENQVANSVTMIQQGHTQLTNNTTLNALNEAERCDLSPNSSLTSPRTSESPTTTRGQGAVDNSDAYRDEQNIQQPFVKRESLGGFSLSSASIESVNSTSPIINRASFLEKSFDDTIKDGLDLILDKASWGNCTASPMSRACTPVKNKFRRRNSNPNKVENSTNSSEATSPTTTPTSASSRDHRNFSWKLSQSLSSSSQCTEAATEVATNRAIDLAMKRIREIEKNGQSAIALQEARNALLNRSKKFQVNENITQHVTKYSFATDDNKDSRKEMQARSLLSVSSNESSRRELPCNKLSNIVGVPTIEKNGYHALKQDSVFRLQGDDASIQSKSVDSSVGVEVSQMYFGGEKILSRNTHADKGQVQRQVAALNKTKFEVNGFIQGDVGSKLRLGDGDTYRMGESYTLLPNQNSSKNLLIPDLYDRSNEKSNVQPLRRTERKVIQTRTYRVATPPVEKMESAFNAVSPCISPPKIVRRARSFEDHSPDPIFCTHSSSIYSSTPNSGGRTASTLSHSFASDDAMFMMDGVATVDSILSPDSLPLLTSRPIFMSLDRKAHRMPIGFARHDRLQNAGTYRGIEGIIDSEEQPPDHKLKPNSSNLLPPSGFSAISIVASKQHEACKEKIHRDENDVNDAELESNGIVCSVQNYSIASTQLPIFHQNQPLSTTHFTESDVHAPKQLRLNSLSADSRAHSGMPLSLHTYNLQTPPPPPPPPTVPKLIHMTASAMNMNSINSQIEKSNLDFSDSRGNIIPEVAIRSKSKLAQTFLAAISKPQCIQESDNNTTLNHLDTVSQYRNHQGHGSLSAHLTNGIDDCIIAADDVNSVDVQSIRSTFESLNNLPCEDDDDSDDDTASVKSLRGRFETTAPKPEIESGIAKIRAKFEAKKSISVKPFHSSNSKIQKTFSKFEEESSRNLPSGRCKIPVMKLKSGNVSHNHVESKLGNNLKKQVDLKFGNNSNKQVDSKLGNVSNKQVETKTGAIPNYSYKKVASKAGNNSNDSDKQVVARSENNSNKQLDQTSENISNKQSSTSVSADRHALSLRSTHMPDRFLSFHAKAAIFSSKVSQASIHKNCVSEKAMKWTSSYLPKPNTGITGHVAVIADRNIHSFEIKNEAISDCSSKKHSDTTSTSVKNSLHVEAKHPAVVELDELEASCKEKEITVSPKKESRAFLELQVSMIDNLNPLDSVDSACDVCPGTKSNLPKEISSTTNYSDNLGDRKYLGIEHKVSTPLNVENQDVLSSPAPVTTKAPSDNDLAYKQNTADEGLILVDKTPDHDVLRSNTFISNPIISTSNGLVNGLNLIDQNSSMYDDTLSIDSTFASQSFPSLNNSKMKVVSDNEEETSLKIINDAPVVFKPVARKPIVGDTVIKPISTKTVAKPLPLKPFTKTLPSFIGNKSNDEVARVETFMTSDQITKVQPRNSLDFLRHQTGSKQGIPNNAAGYPLPKDLQLEALTKHTDTASDIVNNSKGAPFLSPFGKELKMRSIENETLSDSIKSGSIGNNMNNRTNLKKNPEYIYGSSSRTDITSDIASRAKTEEEAYFETESEFSDGVTLDVSIAEVSNLTNPTALMSKTCDRSVSTADGENFGDGRSVNLTESEAKRSEASSSQTSEAAHPLLAKAMRLRPMSDEYSADSFFRTRALLARHWGSTPGLGVQNSHSKEKATDKNKHVDLKSKIVDDPDPSGGWDINRIESSFPIASGNTEKKVNVDPCWNPFVDFPKLPFDGGSTTTTKVNVHVNQFPTDSVIPAEYRPDITTKRDSLQSGKAWQKRAQLVQKAANQDYGFRTEVIGSSSTPSISPQTASSISLSLQSNRSTCLSSNKNVSSNGITDFISQVQSDPTPAGNGGKTAGPGSKHATVMARLSKLKASRIQRAAALQSIRPRSTYRFSQYGSRVSDNDDRSLSTKGSSTRFGGSSFLASLDVE